MAFADIFQNVKNKAVQIYSNFFYEGKDAAPAHRKERAYTSQEQTPPQPRQNQQWQNYQQPQQPVQQQYYGGFQQPYQQPVYQQQPQQAYQQPQQNYQQQPQYAQPEQPQPRFRRSAQHASNVVQLDFGSNQPQQPAPEPAAPQQSASLLSARIINARGMSDCRSAITLLRNGDAVLIVMENITNPGDMRRLVDTLSGACYSLTATITKVSRYGVYLLAPQTLAVFADQATNQMNAGPVRPQAPAYQPNPYAAAQRPVYQNPVQPAQQPYAQQQEFTQRTAAPEAAAQEFYQRPLTQDSTIPSFSNRPAGVGYTPDEHAEAAQ